MHNQLIFWMFILYRVIIVRLDVYTIVQELNNFVDFIGSIGISGHLSIVRYSTI